MRHISKFCLTCAPSTGSLHAVDGFLQCVQTICAPRVADDEDPWDDELAVEEEVARLVKSAKAKDNLQDLDRSAHLPVSVPHTRHNVAMGSNSNDICMSALPSVHLAWRGPPGAMPHLVQDANQLPGHVSCCQP